MRILKNKTKVYGFDELSIESQNKALQYIINRANEMKALNKNYFYSVNDFEWYKNGDIFFHTNNINAY